MRCSEIPQNALQKVRNVGFIGTIRPFDTDKVERALARFRDLSVNGQDAELRRFFNELLPEARLTE